MTNRAMQRIIAILTSGGYPIHFQMNEANMGSAWASTPTLAEFDYETLVDAAHDWIRTQTHFPTLVEFRRHVEAYCWRGVEDYCEVCDGVRFIEAGERTSQPCPACNPSPAISKARSAVQRSQMPADFMRAIRRTPSPPEG